MPPVKVWSPKRDSTLREMVAAGATSNEVAGRLGISQGAVIRRAKRFGLAWAKSRGGRPSGAPVKTKPQPSGSRRNAAPQRTNVAIVKSLPADEKAAIAEFIAAMGVHRVDSGATGDPNNLIDWLSQVCGVKASRVARTALARVPRFVVAGRVVDYPGLVAVVDRERAKRGFAPLARAA